ncbi:MAG: acylphosphatase [Bacteroidetes bacterium]|nr:MAG: acylphosphatase [Bacteroidota bacterium]
MQKTFTIKGRVQGVFFRKYTKEKAMSLGLQGFVQNHADGSVFCCAEGTEEQLNELQAFLHSGSPLSRVDEVIEQDTTTEILSSDFQIR